MIQSGNFVDTGLGYKAFEPEALQNIEKKLDMIPLYRRLDEANTAIGELRGLSDLLPNPEILTSSYGLMEALLSSQIEGTQSTLSEVMAHKEYDKAMTHDTREVVNYLQALDYSIATIQSGQLPICNRLLLKCHAILMKDARGGASQNTPGEFRKSQNYIGGSKPENAFFVPPQHHRINDLMGKLELYLHESPLPHLVKIALIHYQFETIHPFLDGNGRMGRLLIILYLIEVKILKTPTLYVSLYLKEHQLKYYEHLTQIRHQGHYQQWIDFFLQAIIAVSNNVITKTRDIEALRTKMLAMLRSENERKLLNHLFHVPIITIKEVEQELEVTNKTANNLIKNFEVKNILHAFDNKARYRKYYYRDYLDILQP